MTKHSWEVNETEKDIIVDVLHQYCVPFNKSRHEHDNGFNVYYTYTISLDLMDTPLEFVVKKVEERLKEEKSLIQESTKINADDEFFNMFKTINSSELYTFDELPTLLQKLLLTSHSHTFLKSTKYKIVDDGKNIHVVIIGQD